MSVNRFDQACRYLAKLDPAALLAAAARCPSVDEFRRELPAA